MNSDKVISYLLITLLIVGTYSYFTGEISDAYDDNPTDRFLGFLNDWYGLFHILIGVLSLCVMFVDVANDLK